MSASTQRSSRRHLLKSAGAVSVFSGLASVDGWLSRAARGSEPSDPLRGIDDYVHQAMADWQVPGLSLAVVVRGENVLARGYGNRAANDKTPVDERTVFGIRSVTKSFTAACIAMLVDKGKLAWDDPVIKHFPDFQLFDAWVTREITIRDLLAHRSGLPLGNMLWSSGAFDREEILRRLRLLEPKYGFRSRFSYQNILYLAAGELVAKVAGTSWDAFVQKRIFEPLGMLRSSTTGAALPRDGNVAAPCALIDGQAQVVEWTDLDRIGPAGSINSCAADMAHWVKLHLAAGKHAGGSLFSGTTATEMHSPQSIIHAPAGDGTTYPKSHFKSYGLGWFVSDYRGRKLVEHSGSGNGFVAWAAFLPEEQVGFVILANLHETGLNFALRHWILDRYLGLPDRDWSAVVKREYAEGYQAAFKKGRDKFIGDRIEGTTPTLPLETYAGTYEGRLYGKIEVRLENDSLRLAYGTRRTGKLAHWQHDTFWATFDQPLRSDWIVTFSLDANKEHVMQLHARETPWAPPYMEEEDLGTFQRID